MSAKPRVVKDYDKIDDAIKEQIKLFYPYGFDKDLVTFKNAQGKFVSALPFEAEDKYYLIRMTRAEALEIMDEDEDFDDDGNLKDEIKHELEVKYDDEELISVDDDESEDDMGTDDDD